MNDIENNDASNAPQDSSESKVVRITRQYIKDFSFENPNSPSVLLQGSIAPDINVNIGLKVNDLKGGNFEVVIKIDVKAKKDEQVMFISDLEYAGVFTLNNIGDEEKESVLMVYCPSLLFPFARRVVADITRDGGFPPLMLDPVDFMSLYQQSKQQQQQAQDEPVSDSIN
ncbi:MAG: protein-export chaperone SecB [Pseudomonadota bacterium]